MKFLLLFLLTLSLSRSANTFIWGVTGRFVRTTSPRIINRVNALGSNQRIEPTFYLYDLYKVLGVNSSASKQELKKAYYDISAKHHPDKDASPEALSIFRNASYAYKILGKDQSTRNEYDAKYKTLRYIEDVEEYMNVLSLVGNDVIKPFAMGVALPLLNFTFQSLRSFAVPIFRDTAETTGAVLQEATRGSSYSTQPIDLEATAGERLNNAVGGAGDLLARTTIAVRNKRYEQSVRKLSENVLQTQTTIARNKKGLKNAYESETNLTDRLAGLVNSEKLLRAMLTSCDSEVHIQRGRAEESSQTQVESQNDANKRIAAIASNEVELSSAVQSVVTVTAEVRALESRLADARVRLLALETQQSALVTSLADDRIALALTVGTLEVATTSCTEQQRALGDLETRRVKIDGKLRRVEEEKGTTELSIQRQQSYSGMVEKKVQEQEQKLVSLRQKVVEVGAAWEQFGRKEGIKVTLKQVIQQQEEEILSRKMSKDEDSIDLQPNAPISQPAVAHLPGSKLADISNPIQDGWASFLEGDEDLCFDFEDEKNKFLEQEAQKTLFVERATSSGRKNAV